jgi:hypothetical protein
MDDDWRLHVSVHEPHRAAALTERLDAASLEHELETAFRDRVIVSSDGPDLFLYTGSRAQAEAAERLVRRLAQENDWMIDLALARWHPEAQAWEDPDVPLPATDAELAAEHAHRLQQERAEAREQGFPSFEVRVHCATDQGSSEFARRLQAEGLPVVRRGRYLVVGAADEDTANALAERFHREAPDGSAVLAEGTVPAVLNGSPTNPFAIFGGLGG